MKIINEHHHYINNSRNIQEYQVYGGKEIFYNNYTLTILIFRVQNYIFSLCYYSFFNLKYNMSSHFNDTFIYTEGIHIKLIL